MFRWKMSAKVAFPLGGRYQETRKEEEKQRKGPGSSRGAEGNGGMGGRREGGG